MTSWRNCYFTWSIWEFVQDLESNGHFSLGWRSSLKWPAIDFKEQIWHGSTKKDKKRWKYKWSHNYIYELCCKPSFKILMQAMNQWSNHSHVPLCFVTRSPKFSSCFKGSNGSYFSVTWNLRFIQSSTCCFSSPTVIPSECNPVLWPPPRQSYLQRGIKINQFTSFSQWSILLLSWP